MGMMFGTWNRSGSLKTVASLLVKYNLDIVAVSQQNMEVGILIVT